MAEFFKWKVYYWPFKNQIYVGNYTTGLIKITKMDYKIIASPSKMKRMKLIEIGIFHEEALFSLLDIFKGTYGR